jgi:ketosteroid isomerase-like protein
MDAREIADRLALRELACRYARAVDRRDYRAFVALFLPDAVLCGPGYEMPGHEAIEAGIRLIERYEATQHCVHNELFSLHGDEATGEVYCVAYHLYAREGEARRLDMGVRYQDRYRRTPAGWRFARRELVVDWQHDLAREEPR